MPRTSAANWLILKIKEPTGVPESPASNLSTSRKEVSLSERIDGWQRGGGRSMEEDERVAVSVIIDGLRMRAGQRTGEGSLT